MLFTHTAYIGIDPTAGRSPFTYAALDDERNLLALADGELEDVLTFVGNFPAATAAVNAPSRVNAGLVRKRLEKQTLTPHSLRGLDLRVAEHDLRERGISVSATPSREETCAGWVQLGFSLYKRLAKMGFRQFHRKARNTCGWRLIRTRVSPPCSDKSPCRSPRSKVACNVRSSCTTRACVSKTRWDFSRRSPVTACAWA